MSTLTKEQRHLIYTTALGEFCESRGIPIDKKTGSVLFNPRKRYDPTSLCLCGSLDYALIKLINSRGWSLNCNPFYELKLDLNQTQFPEIVRHRPANYGVYWWDSGRAKERLHVLLQAIEDTK